MKRLLSFRSALSFATACVGGYVLYVSWGWPFRTALFPRVVAVPLLLLSLVEFVLNIRGGEGEREGHAVDFQFTDAVEPALARKRTIAMSLWTLGFLALIVLVGFPLAVPLFVFAYLKIAGREPWGLTVVLTAVSWLVMEALFNRLLHLPFPEGWIFALWT